MLLFAHKWFTTVMARVTLVACIAVTVWACQPTINNGTVKINKEILQQWQGDLPVSSLVLLPPESHQAGAGYINNTALLKTIWPHFQPDIDIPNIDFKQNIIVYHYNTQFFNRNRIFRVEVSSGVVEVLAMETLSAMPIEDNVAFAMAVIARGGINSIKTRDGLLKLQKLD